MHTRTRRAAALAVLALLPLAGCAGTDAASSEPLAIADAWVKTAESGMTAAFGTLTNSTDADITVTGASTPAAPMVELHDVIDGTMMEVDGGFTVPANGTLTLEPGALHLMLMKMTEPIIAGDDVAITLELSTGDTLEFEALAKDFDGAEEDYESDHDDMSHDG
ncbi:copper chaperone PCu(A)C [Demequina pelophila]|uniref:copper chaperone PCu(A)C n=1 Tax=Demequina pelophila TaxID=1638984 RepID=UPI00078427BC|nr:copper chaperone PCu(A)C [Demequina pelophila]